MLGQALLTKRMGKTRIIAETGAGQHGVASATAAALMGLECTVYMGEEDTRRQALNVARMRLLGAEVVPVTTGSRTLKDAMNEAMRDWVTNVERTHYLIGTVAGPHPFPRMVREFHRVIGDEARAQMLELVGRLPDAVLACVGGGSNAIGIFQAFIDDVGVRLVGLEAGGDGVATGRHAASITGGSPGVLHGARSYVLQDEDGQTVESHSISAGLDYPGVGPEHAWLHDTGRATYEPVDDAEAMEAFRLLCRTEGIIPAIESAHALAGALRLGRELGPTAVLLVNLSGRGDKDVDTAARWFGLIEGRRASERRCRAERLVPRHARAGTGSADRLPAGGLPGRRDVGAGHAGHGAGRASTSSRSACRTRDPLMDGPVIQYAVDAALRAGARTSRRLHGGAWRRRRRRRTRW